MSFITKLILNDSAKILFLMLGIISLHSAASDIKGHVEAAARELSLERFANFESELYQVIDHKASLL